MSKAGVFILVRIVSDGKWVIFTITPNGPLGFGGFLSVQLRALWIWKYTKRALTSLEISKGPIKVHAVAATGKHWDPHIYGPADERRSHHPDSVTDSAVVER